MVELIPLFCLDSSIQSSTF